MASVHKDSLGRSRYYFAFFRGADGKRKKKVTKETSRREALKVAIRWEQAALKARRGELVEAQAQKVVSDILEDAGLARLKVFTAEEFSEKWLASKKSTLSPPSYLRYKKVVDDFLAFLGEDGKRRGLAHVGVSEVQGFIDSQVDAGKAQSTANVALKILRSLFGRALKQQVILHNPASAVEAFPDSGEQREVFTLDQTKALLNKADAEWRGMVLLSFYGCGMRIGDAASLTWENIDFERGVLGYRPQKTRRTNSNKLLEVPLHDSLRDYLLGLKVKGKSPKTPLFPTLHAVRVGGANGLSLRFKELMEEAGIEEVLGEAKKGAGRQFSKLSFHSLRHSAVSALTNAGVAPELRRKLTGHKSVAVHERYTHHELEPLRDAVSKLPRL